MKIWQKFTGFVAKMAAGSFYRGADLDMSFGDGTGESPDLGSQPYKRSAWVHAAVKHVARPVSAMPLEFVTDRSGAEDDVLDDPEINRFWQRPARRMTGLMSRSDFMEHTASWLALAGEFFWVMDDTWLMNGGVKSPLLLVRPDDMEEIRENGDRGPVTAWRMRTASGSYEILIPEQVIHVAEYNPYDEVRGLAPWMAARIAAEGDYAAGVFAKNLMENNGDRGPYIVAKGAPPTEEQQKQIERAIREKRRMNRRGTTKATFLSADMEVRDPAVQSTDSDFVAQRIGNRHEIFIAFGVPPSMGDLVASYSVGSASDWFRLIHGTCMPVGNKITEAIEQVTMCLRAGRALTQEELVSGKYESVLCNLDWDEHPVMQQVRGERLDSAKGLLDNGMPMSVASEYLGLKVPEYSGWDVGYLPANKVAVSSEPRKARKARNDQESEERKSDSGFGAMVKMLEGRRLEEPQNTRKTQKLEGRCGRKMLDGEEKDPVLERVMVRRGPVEKLMEGRVSRWLMEVRRETLSNIGALDSEAATVEKMSSADVTAADVIFDLETAAVRLAERMRPASETGLAEAVAGLFEEIGFTDPWSEPAEGVLEFLRVRENRMKDAAENVWDDVRAAIEESIDSGDSLKVMADRVRERFNGISRSRARTIARTEAGAAFGAGRQFGMEDAGIELKEWHTSGLDNVRATHREANGQQVPVDEPFIVGGVEMMYPGDENGPPEEVINCRCVSLPVV
jgi:SPP1 gp7 family putative phage head morphogenesis protein